MISSLLEDLVSKYRPQGHKSCPPFICLFATIRGLFNHEGAWSILADATPIIVLLRPKYLTSFDRVLTRRENGSRIFLWLIIWSNETIKLLQAAKIAQALKDLGAIVCVTDKRRNTEEGDQEERRVRIGKD